MNMTSPTDDVAMLTTTIVSFCSHTTKCSFHSLTGPRLRWENRPSNRPTNRETGYFQPCFPANDQLCYPNRLRFSRLPCPQYGGWRSVPHSLCKLFQTCRRIGVYLSSEEHLHRRLTRQGPQDMTDSNNLPGVCLLWKNVSVTEGLRRMSHGPQHFESNN